MSLLSTGEFKAAAAGLDLSFDGRVWTCPEAAGSDWYLTALNRETPLHTGTHITAPEAGRKILTALFGAGWREISARSDAPSDKLPEGAID